MHMDQETIDYVYQHFAHRFLTDDEKKIISYRFLGFETVKLVALERIMTEHKNEIFFNRCAKCNRLARTPYASQCRYCGYSWHNQTPLKK